MKKTIALFLVIALALFVISCNAQNNQATSAAPQMSAAATASAAAGQTSAQNTAGDAAKTGLAVINSIAKSQEAAQEDGLAEIDSTVVAVTIDKDGKIVKCQIDQAQTKVTFNAQGKITTPLNTKFQTKQELAAGYGMATASKIKKEWFEQANALAAYVIGKTVDEVKGIAVNEEGAPLDAELAGSVTISISSFIAAIEKAVTNAQDLGAKTTDTLGLGITTNIEKSKDAAEEDGLVEASSSYIAATFDANGKITSCIAEGSNSDVKFSAKGKITSDLNAAPPTKRELGAAYGMSKASSIKKEWFEQADALGKYVIGKTADEVKGIAVNEEGAATDAELASSVTISITDYIDNIQKSAANAK